MPTQVSAGPSFREAQERHNSEAYRGQNDADRAVVRFPHTE
jgi:hypothetical protein